MVWDSLLPSLPPHISCLRCTRNASGHERKYEKSVEARKSDEKYFICWGNVCLWCLVIEKQLRVFKENLTDSNPRHST